jgi:AraC-like DNA-binding protein
MGLHVYSEFDLTRFGPMGHLLRTAPDLLTGLSAVAPLIRAVDTGTRLKVTDTGQEVEVIFYNADQRYVGNRYDIVQTLMFMIATVRTYADPKWAPKLVEFQFSSLDETAQQEYQAVIRSPMHYSRPVNRIVCDRATFLKPLPDADEAFFRFLEMSIRRSIEGPSGNNEFLNDLRDQVEQRLSEGCRVTDIATTMGLTARAMQQRLTSAGSSYREIVQKVRQQIACQRLRSGDVVLTALAADLGYSETSAFVRAFHRWTGTSPLRYARLEGRLAN